MDIVLTVADHEKNGFVALAKFAGLEEERARAFIAAIDASIPPEAEPDIKTAPFTFVLDLMDGDNRLLDNGERLLPTQEAMRLAPDQVSAWLRDKPVPDDVFFTEPPTLSLPTHVFSPP